MEDIKEEVVVEDTKSEFVKKLEELSGRTFKDDADADKHYKNLNSFVGKKLDDHNKELDDIKVKNNKYESFFKDLGKTVDEVNPFELNRLVSSMKPRTAVDPTPAAQNSNDKLEQLGKAALKGNQDAKVALVEEYLGLKEKPVNAAEVGTAQRLDSLRYK